MCLTNAVFPKEQVAEVVLTPFLALWLLKTTPLILLKECIIGTGRVDEEPIIATRLCDNELKVASIGLDFEALCA